MQKQTILIYFLLAVIIVGGLFGGLEWSERDRAHEIELRRAKQEVKSVRDSVQKVIIRKDKELLRAMQETAEADMIAKDAVLKANTAINETKRIKHISTRNDAERDSLLRSVIGN